MKRKIIQIAVIALLLTGFCGIVFAETLEEMQTKRNELQDQIAEGNQEIQEIQIELTENLEQLNNLNEKISNYENDIQQLQENLEKVENDIKVIEERLYIVENNYQLQRNALQTRIVSLYESGEILYLDVLLSSNSVSDFITNYFLIGEIVQYDNNLLEDIENQKTQIEVAKNTLQQKQKNVKEAKENKEKTTIALENARIIRNTYISKLTEEEKATQAKIDGYKQELDDIEKQIVAIATSGLDIDFVGGEFLWPCPGYYTITSRFGIRVHPILKVIKSHSGTDIACPTGTNILAANDGIVIASTYSNTGYGNMVMIDHGGGIVSLYGHGSELIAQVGQEVKRGDVIMKSGSTGWSTGPHLHFEIRVNGVAVDSLPYITGGVDTSGKKNNENNTTENTVDNNQNSTENMNVIN